MRTAVRPPTSLPSPAITPAAIIPCRAALLQQRASGGACEACKAVCTRHLACCAAIRTPCACKPSAALTAASRPELIVPEAMRRVRAAQRTCRTRTTY